jgi:hypothetical protein
MIKTLKSTLDLYTCWSPILSLPTWIIVGMVVTGIFGAKYVLLPVFAVWIITWFLVAVYFETYSSLQESFDKNLGLGLTIYNTVGLVVLIYLVVNYYGVLLVEMTPPI